MKSRKSLNLKDYISLFKALGDSSRMAIFSRILCCSSEEKKNANVKEISTCCDLDLSVISRHLSILKDADVLDAKKEGKEVFYSINHKRLAKRLRELADILDSSTCQIKRGEDHE